MTDEIKRADMEHYVFAWLFGSLEQIKEDNPIIVPEKFEYYDLRFYNNGAVIWVKILGKWTQFAILDGDRYLNGSFVNYATILSQDLTTEMLTELYNGVVNN